MKLTPIKCPNCAASIKLDREAELVSCTHCESSFFIEWPADATGAGASGQTSQPTAPRSHYYVVRGYNPFASCPFCSAQVLRTADNAGQQVECVECRQSAILPAFATQSAMVCRECHRAHFEARCPDCTRERGNARSWNF